MTQRFLFCDFDNTLMATENLQLPPLIARFNMLYAAQIGRELMLDEFLKHFIGIGGKDLCDVLSDYFGIIVDCPLLFAHREWLVMETFRHHTVPMAPNVISALRSIQARGVTLAIVSNNRAQRCLAAMRYATEGNGEELAVLFGTRMFEAGDVKKPDPTVYRHAMIQLDAAPESSYAVEDSPTGLHSALGAGLTTFGFTGYAEDPARRAAELMDLGASACFDDWSQLPELLVPSKDPM